MLRALQPIEHDGRRYAPGELLRVDGAAAEALVAAAAAEPAPEDAAAAAEPAQQDAAAATPEAPATEDAATPRPRARRGG
jgi:hypothetical protein